jgi:hypothetical protein
MLTLNSLERRSSGVRGALGLTLVLSLAAGALAQSPNEPTWRFTLREGASVPSTVTLVNRCRERHRFRIEREGADFVAVDLAAEGVNVAPGASREVAVRFDAGGKGTGRYAGALVVACVDCVREPGCSQDRDVFGIEMTVVASEPPALWLTNLPFLYHGWGARTINEAQGEDGGWRRARPSRSAFLAAAPSISRAVRCRPRPVATRRSRTSKRSKSNIARR